jgi:hypothetical protein
MFDQTSAMTLAGSVALLEGTNSWPVALRVPETLHSSRDLLILGEQSTEPVAPLDGVRLACRPLEGWS